LHCRKSCTTTDGTNFKALLAGIAAGAGPLILVGSHAISLPTWAKVAAIGIGIVAAYGVRAVVMETVADELVVS
jgi:hypothetical protein